MRRAWLLACCLLAAATGAGQAEVARLQIGANRFGQGWLFLDRDGRCKLLTAGHVAAPEGTPLPVIVIDRRGRQLVAEAPEVLSLERTTDVAVLPVQVGREPADCSRSRLSMVGLDRRVQGLRDGVIETTGGSETQLVPVERTASRIDAGGGQVFSVRPRDPAVRLAQGWSGSIVRDGEGALGVVSAVDEATNEAIVVRVDVIPGLRPARAQAAAEPPGGAAFARIAVERGETLDAAAGPLGAVDPRRPAWIVRAVGGRVTVVVSAERARPVQRVVVELGAGASPALVGVDVEVGLRAAAQLQFEPVRTCRAGASTNRLTCGFLEQDRADLRISFLLSTSEPTPIRSIRIE